MTTDAKVQIATGQTVRTVETTVLQSDGSLATVETQVVALADRQGAVIDFSNLEGLLERLNDNIEELLFEIRLQNETNEE